MSTKKIEILFIEDDPDLPALLKSHLEVGQYRVTIAADGQEGLALARKGTFDILVVDYTLPSISGVDIVRRLREEGQVVPILMLTSRSEEIDKVLALNTGADDYVTKPFALAELMARINALLRRSAFAPTLAAPASRLVIGPLTIDLEMRRVFVDSREIDLTPLEFNLLAYLAKSPGRPFDRVQILEDVWETSVQEYEYSLTSVIARLRKKLEVDPGRPKFILTLRGTGYRLARPDEL